MASGLRCRCIPGSRPSEASSDLGPIQLGLLPHVGGHRLCSPIPKHGCIARHLALARGSNYGDPLWSINAIALQGRQMQVFAAANDVAAIDVAASAMVGEQLGPIRRRGSPGPALITSTAITPANNPNLANPNLRNSFCSTLAILLSMIPVCACRR